MAKITAIPATINRYSAVPISGLKKRRVAAYARVSTDHEEQLTSYEAQVDYYTSYIKGRQDWEFVAVYTDEGITGCNTKKREGFKKMVADALSGAIDLIVTKSVSRFARNTVDSLTTIRKLKEHNVECYFEKENIWTFDGKGELLLTIMSSLAQEESRSISENCTWGQRKRFSDGKYSVAYSHFLGYDRGENGEFIINEEQAEIVRRIYGLFLQGRSPYAIAKLLTQEGIPTPSGKTAWSKETVRSILSNEKYKGSALLQKNYTVDFLTKKQKKNKGEIQQYYVEDSHPAIIPPAIFDMVQRQLEVRHTGKDRKSCASVFSGKIVCGDCGSYFGSKVWHSNDKYRRVIWQCNHKFNGVKCGTPHLTDQQLQNMFVTAANKILVEKDALAAAFETVRDRIFCVDELAAEREGLLEEMSVASELIQKAISQNARVAQNQEKYQQRYEKLVQRFESAKERLTVVDARITEKNARRETTEMFLETLRRQEGFLTAFDERLWYSLVDHITVYSAENVRFTFKDGTEIQVGEKE